MDKEFSAEDESFSIQLFGHESHAAESENGINPATTISEIVTAMSVLDVGDINKVNFAFLTDIHMDQKSYGVTPANGELHYTIYKSAMFGLGAGIDTPPLLDASYCFPGR